MGEGESAGGGIAGLGVVLIFVGIICYIFPQEQDIYLGLATETIYPYREIGELLLILGIVVAVIGGIVAAVASSASTLPPPSQQVHQHYYQQPSSQTQQPQTNSKYCQSCGRSIPVDGVLCPYCGVNQR